MDGLLRGWPLGKACKRAALKDPGVGLRRSLKQDYVRYLRRGLSYGEVQTLVAAFRRIFPQFNARAVAMMTSAGYRRVADQVGVHLQMARYEEDDGLALRGFYVAEKPGYLARPLIFVNTAHQRLAAGTTFIHELGHHVAARLLRLEVAPVHYFFDSDYARHLSDRAELAADIMVSLAGYPQGVARRIFSTTWNWGLVARAANLTDDAFAEVRQHLKKAYGFDLPLAQIPADQRLPYLAAMIHYAKLRWALLAEYDL
ncbi:MAG: hypothetical protein ACRETH_00265 [Steroidobacteraceae bacterium]